MDGSSLPIGKQIYLDVLIYDDYITTNYYQINMVGRQTQYLHDIVDSVVTYNIPNELIIKVDQTRC